MKNENTLDVDQIMKAIPHRYPFLLIDKIISYIPLETATAIKNVTINEPFFKGHFPQKPVMPGVLMIEALAQAGCVLNTLSYPDTKDKLLYLVEVRNARFKRQVVPGDQLNVEVNVEKVRGSYLRFEGTASVDGELACSASIVGMRG